MSGAQESELAKLEQEYRRLQDQVSAQTWELNLLRARFARYETALRGSQVTVYTQDGDLRYTSISNPMLGRSIEEILGHTDLEILPSDSSAAIIAAKREVLRSGEAKRTEVPLDEPGGGAPCHSLEIGDPEGLAAREQRQRTRMADCSRSRECAARAAELALPPVRVRKRVRLPGIVRGEAGERAQPFALGRRRLDRPREPCERPPRRVPAHVVGIEELAHPLPERTWLAR